MRATRITEEQRFLELMELSVFTMFVQKYTIDLANPLLRSFVSVKPQYK